MQLDDLEIYFYALTGLALLCLLLIFIIFILIGVLFGRVGRLKMDSSNQLGRQTRMMDDFCYTNPSIVPGEELSRRGFSMYSGSESFNDKNTWRARDESRHKF
ncbi:uncharacterized protein LOC106647534 [Copidosoma floridanum]|uniref:uncharacterized protein LOC106647534 n=1 Tax=Copidosoma floridanum TaxID=29053 RepID=UPI0006C9D50A|nr:uncharacterized protein LOC106647534 [Copidosoma floridanum]XP_014219466.1 uncharacterized protein LOC106647534 [Copidosoma floridanum]